MKIVASLKNCSRFLIKYKFLNFLVLPGIIFYIIFYYTPMYGIIIAFKDYNGLGGFEGIIDSKWVGLTHFANFFGSNYFWRLLRNTLVISFYRLIFGFPAPIILALLLNEVYNNKFKRIVQSICYLPHFLSWVVISGLMVMLLSTDGPINQILVMLGLDKIPFLTDSQFFRSILVGSSIWQGIGWGTIVFLAAISNVPAEMYEAAIVEGANRWQRSIYITLPSISFIIVILFILRVGKIIDEGFEQTFNLYNPSVYEVSDVFETFVYRRGIQGSEFSYTAAVGLFKSVTSLALVWGSNRLAKLFGQEGIW